MGNPQNIGTSYGGNRLDPNDPSTRVTTRESMDAQHVAWIRRQDDAKVVIVCGGRDYPDRARVFAALDLAHAKQRITLIVHGACRDPRTGKLRGADRWADEWARAHGVWVEMFEAEWQALGPRAGPERNARMVKAGGHGCLALPGGAGTSDCSRRCEAAGIPVWRPFG